MHSKRCEFALTHDSSKNPTIDDYAGNRTGATNGSPGIRSESAGTVVRFRAQTSIELVCGQ